MAIPTRYNRNDALKAMYRFFKDPNLRFYLNDFIGLTHIVTGPTRHYNPLVLYIMYKNRLNMAKNISWWTEHKDKIFANSMFQSLAEMWNAEHTESQITLENVDEMILASYDEWSHEEENDNKLPHYVYFGKEERLSKFFSTFLKDTVDNLIPDIEMPTHDQAESNVPESDPPAHEHIDEDHGDLMIDEYGNEYHNYESIDDDQVMEQTDQTDQLMEIVIAEENRHDNNFPIQSNPDTFEDDVMEIRKRIESEPLKAKELFDGRTCNKGDHTCSTCGFRFVMLQTLRTHYRDVHNEFMCIHSQCDFPLFSSESEFSQHMEEIHNYAQCDICGTMCQQIKLHIRSHFASKEDNYKCLLCGKEYSHLYHFQLHEQKCGKQIVCEFEECKFVFSTLRQKRAHRTLHTCSDKGCAITFSTIEKCVEHESVHYSAPCKVCTYYNFSSMRDYLYHTQKCHPSRKNEIENQFVDFANNSYDLFELYAANPSDKSNIKVPLFVNSILFQKLNGDIFFDPVDGYPFWRKDIIVPFFGSFSYVKSKMSTNQERNENIQCPSLIKTYMFGVYPLGDTALIHFNTLLRQMEYSYQGFDLNLWNEFRASGMKKDRSSIPFRKNNDIEMFLQKSPEVSGCDKDRGHLTPFYMACSLNDQIQFQMQGNLFYQQSNQNRTVWRSLEMSVPGRMKAKRSTFAHITTAVVYARDKDAKFIYDSNNGKVVVVEYYFKVIFYENENGKVIDIDCFLMKNQDKNEKLKIVTLYDLESLKNNHLKFLNGDLIKRLATDLLDIHSKPSGNLLA